MSVNDAIDLIEQIRKCVESKDNSEIKKLWGKLEDLARDEQVLYNDVSSAFVEMKPKKFKHHKFDDEYVVTLTVYYDFTCDSLDKARVTKRVVKKYVKKLKKQWKSNPNKYVIDIVRKGMV